MPQPAPERSNLWKPHWFPERNGFFAKRLFPISLRGVRSTLHAAVMTHCWTGGRERSIEDGGRRRCLGRVPDLRYRCLANAEQTAQLAFATQAPSLQRAAFIPNVAAPFRFQNPCTRKGRDGKPR